MVKKCIVCDVEAIYKIKDTSDFYCKECAEENFADLNMLLKLEEEAKRLKEFLKIRIQDITQNEDELDKMITIKEKKDNVGEDESKMESKDESKDESKEEE